MTSNPPQSPYLIVGLGNPGKRYRLNRHNTGFMLVDLIANEMGISFSRSRGHALIAESNDRAQTIILAKPQTFMNLSGNSVRQLVRLYKISLPHLLVAFDELDLDLGVLRMRPAGGSSGHKGMRSIINQLGTQSFPRLRMGIGRPSRGEDPSDFVLKDFTPSERPIIEETFERGAACVNQFIEHGIDSAMNICNSDSDSR